MKVPTLPNDPEVKALIDVNTELTLALEAYEQHCMQACINRMDLVCKDAMDYINDRGANLTEEQSKIVALELRKAVSSAVTEVNARVNIHERALGMVSEHSPSEIVKKAITGFNDNTRKYWDNVSN